MLQQLLSNLREAVWLLLASGLLILFLEPRTYQESGWWKERRASIILAWINISLAVLAFAATWFVHEGG
jgi:hypothetical protein